MNASVDEVSIPDELVGASMVLRSRFTSHVPLYRRAADMLLLTSVPDFS